MIQTDNLIAAAAIYASWGWPVFRLQPGDKTPLPGTRGYLDATSDPATAGAMWCQMPNANIGIATGKAAGIWVLDVDTKYGKQGMRSLYGLCKLIRDESLLDTATVRTYSGGLHLYYRYPQGREIGRRISAFKRLGLPDIDVVGDNGYIVAPPSMVSEGQYEGQYNWLTDDLADTPPALLAALDAADRVVAIRKAEREIRSPRTRSTDGLLRWLEGRSPGEQDDALNWAVWKLREKGKTVEEVADLVRPIVSRWPAKGKPWTERDIQRHLRSAFR